MTTLSEITNKLMTEGYELDFNVTENTTDGPGKYLNEHPDEFVIDKHYRFEGMSDPEDEAMVYAISQKNGGMKGVLINGYGASSNEDTNDLVKQLEDKSSEEEA